MVGSLEVNAPEVGIDRQPAMVIRPPLKGKGWLATTACCEPNVHRDLRVAIDDVFSHRHAETFAIDWSKVKNDRLFDGERVERSYRFGAVVLAVADGTVVSIHDAACPMHAVAGPRCPEVEVDYGGNNVFLEIAPNIFASVRRICARAASQ